MTYPYQAMVSTGRNRDRAYEAVIRALEQAADESGLNRKKIAETLGTSKALISTWLSGPSNWSLDTIDHLLYAADAEMEYKVVFNKDRRKPNFHILPSYGNENTLETIESEKLSSISVTTTSTGSEAVNIVMVHFAK